MIEKSEAWIAQWQQDDRTYTALLAHVVEQGQDTWSCNYMAGADSQVRYGNTQAEVLRTIKIPSWVKWQTWEDADKQAREERA
jgi:predicted phosphoadenosine phosphosulfate sulfurtransferase